MVRSLSIGVLLLLVVLPLLAGSMGLWQWPAGGLQGLQQLAWSSWLTSATRSLWLTLLITLVVCYAALWMGQAFSNRQASVKMEWLLGVPHVALAVGLLLLLSPSGWLVRLLHSWFECFPSPPRGWWFADKSLLAMASVLVLKELPFLLLMVVAQIRQLPLERWQRQAQSLGYSKQRSWWLLCVPALLPRIFLPLVAIAIYSLSVVDVALIVGPNTPPLLAARVHEVSLEYGQQAEFEAWLGQVSLVVMGLIVLAILYLQQGIYCSWARRHLGQLRPKLKVKMKAGVLLPRLLLWLCAAAIALLALQSLNQQWFYPSLWGQGWSPARWLEEWPFAQPLLLNSLVLAMASGALGTLAAIIVLERQRQQQRPGLAWLPLLVLFLPQLPLVLGWQRLVAQDSHWGWLLWSHVVYTFPYAYLVLHGAYVRFPQRWFIQAQSLGHSRIAAWFLVLLPQLKYSLALSFAVAVSVSIAQYLPTIWLAAATYPTLTTETVSIAAGGDWRLASIYALLQTLIPVAVLWWASRQRGHKRDRVKHA